MIHLTFLLVLSVSEYSYAYHNLFKFKAQHNYMFFIHLNLYNLQYLS